MGSLGFLVGPPFIVFAGHLAVTERVAGSLQLRIIDLATGADHAIAFDEPAYSVMFRTVTGGAPAGCATSA